MSRNAGAPRSLLWVGCRRAPAFIVLVTLIAGPARLCTGGEVGRASAPAADPREKDEADRAVDRGLAYLARQQNPAGHWETGKRNAVTALCLLAFLAGGHTPEANTYAPACRKALEYLVEAVPEDGYIGKTDGSRMYGQGIVTLALAEAYGMERKAPLRAKLKQKLDRMVGVILKAQARRKSRDHQGGWRYQPDSGDSDLSLSGWCALALRSARNCGMEVPKAAIDGAADYVERMYHRGQKGFAYQRGGRVSLATTGVGVLALYLLGREGSSCLKSAAESLVRNEVSRNTRWPYYTFYYTTQAANQVGGRVWETVWKKNSGLLVKRQEKDGSWEKDRDAGDAGRPFSTAMAVLSLSVRNHFLPSYQR